MVTQKIKTGLIGRAKIITASIALIATVMLVFSMFLWSDTQAENGSDVPVTSADLNADGVPYLQVIACNLNYKDYLHVAYGVDTNLVGGMDFAEIKMLFWSEPQSEYLLGTQKYVGEVNDPEGTAIMVGDVTYDDCAVFFSRGIAAKEIGDTLYARAYVTDSDGNIYYSNVVKHGVLDYVYSRYRDAELGGKVTDDQLYLYDNILRYGASAQIMFDYKTDRLVTSHGVRIDVVDGYMTDGFNSGAYIVGDTVTFVANMENEYGPFLYWKDSKGNTVSLNQSFSVTIDQNSTSEIYTAVYTGVTKVTVVGGTLEGGETFGSFLVGDNFTLVAEDRSSEKFVFSHWEDEKGNNVGSSMTLTLSATESDSKVYTSVYYAPSTVTVSGGTLDNGKISSSYAYGSDFTVTASDKSAEQLVFKHWRDEAGNVLGTGNTYTATVTESGADITVIAVYYAPTTVSVTDGTVNGSASVSVAYGDSYTLTANDRSGEKYVFSHWENGNGDVVSYDESLTLTNDNDGASLSYTAVYHAPATVSVTGGTVNGSASCIVAYGESYTVVADVPGGYLFDYWTKNGEKVDNEETFTAVAQAGETVSYVAVFRNNSGAGFDSLSGGALTAGTPVVSDGYNVTLSGSSDNFGAEITANPSDSTDNVLRLNDADTALGGGIAVNVLGDGSFLVFKTDIYFDSFSTNTVLQFLLGSEYKINFTAAESAALKLYDESKQSGYLDVYLRPDTWYEIKIVITTENGVNGKAPRAFVYIDDVCVAESYNVTETALYDSVTIYVLEGTTVDVYLDDIAAYRMDMSEEDEDQIIVSKVIETPSSSSSDRFQNAEILLDAEAVAALKEMDEALFSDNVYMWVARLYDPDSGAFYFSVSGSENYGYLADIETTSQASGVLNSLGIGTLTSLLNAEQKAKLLSWVQTLQSNRDGYYYHPQWGISIGDARRSRDYSYSSASFSASESLAFRLYNEANYRLSGGSSGTKGVTISTAYDNSKTVTLTAADYRLTSPLGISAAGAVSKVILASSTSGDSNVPVHMTSEEAFVGYINGKWNSGCKVAGVHERHLCDNECIHVADENDSYMKLENGKVKFIRGQRCTSCHVCKHSLGHSYGFASVIGTQNSQIKSLGLGDLLVMYYYDVQENVQASLRHKVELAYTGNDGEYAWGALSNVSQKAKADAVTTITEEAKALAKSDYNADNCAAGSDVFSDLDDAKKNELYRMAQAKLTFVADINANGSTIWAALSSEERADLKKQNQNGIWEEEVTYGTISGLLKACGTPGAHGYEFLYAEDAIQSAIDCALFSVYDFTVKNAQAVVSIYNPFNAINGVMGNIRNYGSDKTLVDKCMVLIRSQAAELIENTTGKLRGYLQPDGGFSYNYNGYCVTSQGQPVAISGWNNGIGEGDVNGTALAFGTRSALLSVMGVSVSAPFSGNNNYIVGGFDLNDDGDKTDEYDLDGDGISETFEATCTHSQRFQYTITTKAEIEKVDIFDSASADGTITFDNVDSFTGGTVVTETGSTNKVLEVVDSSSSSGKSVYIDSSAAESSDKNTCEVSFRMKVIASNATTSHQIFLDGSSSTTLRIDLIYSNSGKFTFKNVAASGSAMLMDKDSTSTELSVNATEWFEVDIVVDYAGFDVGGTTYYGTFEVTQGGVTKTAYLHDLSSTSTVTEMRLYSLNGAVNTVWYDDIKVVSNVMANVSDGEYHFDTTSQQMAGDDVLIQNPTTGSYDKVYLLNGGNTAFAAYNYSVDDYATNNVRYNFNSVQLGLLLKDAKAGDRIDLAMLDASGKKITGIYLVVSEYNGNKLVTFHAPNGEILEESIPRTITAADGTVSTTAQLREMILDVNMAKWMTIKLEYHYDMADPQFDIVVRYGDDTKDGYYTATAACLTGVDICDTGADAFNFANLSIKASGKIYIDDLYIRNVYDACDGEHVYIKKATKAFLTGDTENGHDVYYYSCQKCGAKSEQTFVVHQFERVVADEYKVSDASIYSAAIYKESCSVCKAISESTFTYGYPLDDPSKHNFSNKDEEGNITKDEIIPDYLTYSTGAGKWATVLEEKVGDVVNYYLNVGKENASGTNALTFGYVPESGEEIADKYIYEFDFRWQSADHHVSEILYVKAGVYNPKKTEKSTSGTFTASKAGDYVSYNGVIFYTDEWHAMKYLYSRNSTDDGWNATVFIDGRQVQTFSIIGDGIPYVDYETRWPRTQNNTSYPNNVNFDIDRLKATAVATKGHELIELVDSRYLASGATCEKPTTYYKSCKWCGEASEETFTRGNVSGHSFANVLEDKYLESVADCTNAAVYYKSCQICGEASDETFVFGEALGHSDVKTVVTAATKETAEVCYFTCTVCGRKTDNQINGDPLSWTFDTDAMPSEGISIGGFKAGEDVPETGLWARVLEEEVSGVTNYYLNIGKKDSGGTHNLTFTPELADGVTKVTYEMKVRWNSADTKNDSAVLIKFINPDYNGSEGYMRCDMMKTGSSNTNRATLYGDTYSAGVWNTLRYEFTINADGSVTCNAYFNDKTTETFTLTHMFTKLVFETRYTFKQLNLDVDNIYIAYE